MSPLFPLYLSNNGEKGYPPLVSPRIAPLWGTWESTGWEVPPFGPDPNFQTGLKYGVWDQIVFILCIVLKLTLLLALIRKETGLGSI